MSYGVFKKVFKHVLRCLKKVVLYMMSLKRLFVVLKIFLYMVSLKKAVKRDPTGDLFQGNSFESLFHKHNIGNEKIP